MKHRYLTCSSCHGVPATHWYIGDGIGDGRIYMWRCDKHLPNYFEISSLDVLECTSIEQVELEFIKARL